MTNMVIRNTNKNIKKIFKRIRGDNQILSFVIIIPLMILILTYIMAMGTYYIESIYFSQTVNGTFDKVLIEGQLTNDLKNELEAKLKEMNLESTDIIIQSPASEVTDGLDSTYIMRGNTIELSVYTTRQHVFGKILNYINNSPLDKSRGNFGFRGIGMSEAIK